MRVITLVIQVNEANRLESMTTLKVRAVGNSLGVTFPKELVEEMNVKAGDNLTVTRNQDGTFSISSYDPDFAAKVDALAFMRHKYRDALKELANR